jgi:hypothetical protein
MKKKKTKIKKIKPRKVEKLPDGNLLVDAELIVEAAPEPPAEPIPAEINFDPPEPEPTGWAAFFKSFWQ